MTAIHHIYAVAREEPAKRVLMYQGGEKLLEEAIYELGLQPTKDVYPEATGYFNDSMGGLWWVKSYGGAA